VVSSADNKERVLRIIRKDQIKKGEVEKIRSSAEVIC